MKKINQQKNIEIAKDIILSYIKYNLIHLEKNVPDGVHRVYEIEQGTNEVLLEYCKEFEKKFKKAIKELESMKEK